MLLVVISFINKTKQNTAHDFTTLLLNSTRYAGRTILNLTQTILEHRK